MKEPDTMSNTETDRNTADGSDPKGDEVKSTFIVRIWRFLEDYLDVILIAFLPCWVVFYLVLFSILKILPEKLSEMENITDMHMFCAAFVLLGFWAVIAIGRLIRTSREKAIPKPIIFFLLLLNAVILGGCTAYAEALQLKGDKVYTSSNLKLVYEHIDQYHDEHGCYPPQQDMKSLLKTLGLSDRDFAWHGTAKYRAKTFFMNVKSAEYHAPAQDSGYPYLTLRYREHLFGKKTTYVVRYLDNTEHYLEVNAISDESPKRYKSGKRGDPAPYGMGAIHYQPLTGGDLDEFLLQSLKKQDEAISLIQSRTQLQNQTELQPETGLQPQTGLQPPPPPSATP